jgi:hypothetical protein
MITKEQAMQGGRFHFEHPILCRKEVGKRGAVRFRAEIWRSNGRCKTWKRSPEKFKLPIKHGLWDYGYITEQNAQYFHREEDCEALKEFKTEHEELTFQSLSERGQEGDRP